MVAVPANVIEEMRHSHILGLFFHLAMTPPLRIWLGVNDVPAGMASVDPDTNQTYYGGGRLVDIPNLEAVLNGTADRVEFRLSQIDPVSAQKIVAEGWDIRGKAVYVGVTTLNQETYQPMSSIIPLITGRASYLTETSPIQGIEENRVAILGISVGFGITTRARTSQVLWSTAHHRRVYPTDAFCDGTARLERGSTPTWPRW